MEVDLGHAWALLWTSSMRPSPTRDRGPPFRTGCVRRRGQSRPRSVTSRVSRRRVAGSSAAGPGAIGRDAVFVASEGERPDVRRRPIPGLCWRDPLRPQQTSIGLRASARRPPRHLVRATSLTAPSGAALTNLLGDGRPVARSRPRPPDLPGASRECRTIKRERHRPRRPS